MGRLFLVNLSEVLKRLNSDSETYEDCKKNAIDSHCKTFPELPAWWNRATKNQSPCILVVVLIPSVSTLSTLLNMREDVVC